MDKLFGEIDYVAAGEQEADLRRRRATANEKIDHEKSQGVVEYVDEA